MPGTPQQVMFKVRVKRRPEVTNEQWRAHIHAAVIHYSGHGVAELATIGEDEVQVFNHKRRPVVGHMLERFDAADDDFPKYFRERGDADKESDRCWARGMKVRIRALVEDKPRVTR